MFGKIFSLVVKSIARGVINKSAEQERARELLAKIGVEIDPETPCGELSTAEQQIVEIAKALATEVRILVMDEPSAALTLQEVAGLFRIVRDLQSHGHCGYLYHSPSG